MSSTYFGYGKHLRKIIKSLHCKEWKQHGKRKIRRKFKNINKEYSAIEDRKTTFYGWLY